MLKKFMPTANAPSGKQQSDFRVSISENSGQPRDVDLTPGEYTLGSAVTADLIIPNAADEEIMLLRLEHRKEGASIIVVPIAETLHARDRTLPVGVPVLFGDRAKITYEDMTFAINAGATQFVAETVAKPFDFFKIKSVASLNASFKKSSHLSSALALICMGVGLALLSLSGVGSLIFQDTTRETKQRSATGNEPTKIILDSMTKKIAASDLGKTLSLKLDKNHILVTGTLPLEKSKTLKEIIAATSMRYGIDIDTNLKLDSQTPLFAAVAIYPKTYVITHENKKVDIGNTLKDGSLIENITDTTMLINHEGLEFSIDF